MEESGSEHDQSDSEPEVRTKRPRPAEASSSRAGRTLEPDSEDEEEDGMNCGNGMGFRHYEAGQITKVTVENFMCHQKFTLTLGRHLTFITGRNGSGKSAIVAAIQLCLGSLARQTGRGTNVGKYIREGSENPAVLKVTLLNTGPDAFKPEEYGNRITVKRVVSKQSSTYHLLDQNGREVTKLKSELESMLRSFNIFVDTPCCVLTQEESKRLVYGSAKDKYEFFIKATGLKQISDELVQAHANVAEAHARRDAAEPNLDRARAYRRECKERVKEFMALDHHQVQMRQEQAKLFWCEVRVAKGAVAKCLELVQEKQEQVDEAREAMGTSEKADLEARIAHEEAAFDALQEEVEALKEADDEVGHVLLGVQRQELKVKSAVDALKSAGKDLEQRLRTVTAEIKGLTQKAMPYADNEEKALMDRMHALEEEIQRLAALNKTLEASKQVAIADIARLTRGVGGVGSRTHANKHRMDELRRDLQATESGQGNATKFGDQVPQILNRIASTRFQGPMLGPIGMCVTVRDGCERWSWALEQQLFLQLKAFVATSVADRTTMYSILKAVRADRTHPIILQYPSARMPADKHPLPAHIPTIADALVIEEDMVFNALLDQVNMDRVALVKEEGEVLRHLKEHVNGADRLRHGLMRTVTEKAITVAYRGGNQSSEMPRGPHRHLLATDTTAFAAAVREEMEVVEVEVAECAAMTHQLNQRIDAGNAEIIRIQAAAKRNHDAMSACHRKKREQDAKLSEVLESGRVDTSDLQREQGELEEAIASVAFRTQEAQGQHDTIFEEMTRARKEKQVTSDSLADAQRRLAGQTTKTEALARKYADLDRRKGKLQAVLTRREEELVVEMQHLQTCELARDAAIAEAEQQTRNLSEDWDGKPIPLEKGDTFSSVKKKLEQVEAVYEEAKRKVKLAGYTAEILRERYQAAKTAYATMERQFNEACRNMEMVVQQKEQAEVKWARSFKYIVLKARRAFDAYARREGAAATLEVNTDKRELELVVQIDASDKNTKKTNVPDLSGGERSYVTLCLLLALGHVTESPFRLMDEYDVFMDEGRRNDTLIAIQNHCKRADQFSRQMIVISPNSLASVRTSPQVQIFKMPDPIKRSAHGLQQTTLD